MVLRSTEFLPWRCPECKRFIQIRKDATWVVCVGGWIMVYPVPIFWHKPTQCHRIPESEGDPIALLRAMGVFAYS